MMTSPHAFKLALLSLALLACSSGGGDGPLVGLWSPDRSATLERARRDLVGVAELDERLVEAQLEQLDGNLQTVARTLQLRADGSYSWTVGGLMLLGKSHRTVGDWTLAEDGLHLTPAPDSAERSLETVDGGVITFHPRPGKAALEDGRLVMRFEGDELRLVLSRSRP